MRNYTWKTVSDGLDVFFSLAVILCFVKGVYCKTVKLEIRDGSVSTPLHCDGNKRIQLNSYKYSLTGNDTKFQVQNPELLFSACSWRQNCSLSDALVQNITRKTDADFLYIQYGCPSKLTYRRHNSIKTISQIRHVKIMLKPLRNEFHFSDIQLRASPT